jgi:hypothetical protein
MADYYPLIAGAIAGLLKSTPEARRLLYARVRAALLAELHRTKHPDTVGHRLALESAIRKVEAESLRRALAATPHRSWRAQTRVAVSVRPNAARRARRNYATACVRPRTAEAI